ncbi:MAG: signal peptide peptidase SppA [Acidobacteria bacterium]|nr:signal peptide peptidase SppA [Acidobacteriota bacterium]MCW5970933.1 signal peptide peptidase SppA [Blastocatellales bacterium]
MNRSSLIWIFIIAGVMMVGFSIVLIFGAVLMSDDGGFSGGSGDRIAVIPVEGVINDETAKRVNRHLKQYGADRRVKAILLRVDSPGGGVAASQEIYREVKRVKEDKKKKIVVSMGTVAASGGYYIAAPADWIVANPGTITGSIGVIAEWINFRDLAAWAKIRPEVFKSGEFKDTGSPTREMSPREREYFQAMILELYNQFVAAVVDGRTGRKELDAERVRKLADGRVYTGQAAVDNGLADAVGNYEDAVRETARLVGIRGEPQVITPPRPRKGFSLLDLLGGSNLEGLLPSRIPDHIGEIDTSVKFKYQWK